MHSIIFYSDFFSRFEVNGAILTIEQRMNRMPLNYCIVLLTRPLVIQLSIVVLALSTTSLPTKQVKLKFTDKNILM